MWWALVGVLIADQHREDLVQACCQALARLCVGAAANQDKAASCGSLPALVSCLREAGSPATVAVCCRALEHLATGVGAATRRNTAVDAGALTAVVDALRSSDGSDGPGTCMTCLAALRSLTRDSGRLQDAARDAGAEAALAGMRVAR